jgi:hypothetical protein
MPLVLRVATAGAEHRPCSPPFTVALPRTCVAAGAPRRRDEAAMPLAPLLRPARCHRWPCPPPPSTLCSLHLLPSSLSLFFSVLAACEWERRKDWERARLAFNARTSTGTRPRRAANRCATPRHSCPTWQPRETISFSLFLAWTRCRRNTGTGQGSPPIGVVSMRA